MQQSALGGRFVPTSRGGRLAASGYLLLVLGAVLTWLVAGFTSAPDAIFTAGFDATLILTLPLGYVGYGALATAAVALPGDGVRASVIIAVLVVLIFMGAAVVNAITARGLWRWWNGRRRTRRKQRQAAAAP